MNNVIIEGLTSIIGTAGFLIFFKLNIKNVVPALLCSLLTWIMSYIMTQLGGGIFSSTLIAALFASLFSEITARIFKSPSNMFLIPGLLPLLPGATLYYTMLSLITGKYAECITYGLDTVYAVFGISLGILIASVIFEYILLFIRRRNSLEPKSKN